LTVNLIGCRNMQSIFLDVYVRTLLEMIRS
jgi:hypothetical protein